jgi:hypothetical protein
MKINHDTAQVLKNFSSINPGIIIKQGNEIATISPDKTVLAKATVNDAFPKECAIDNLPRLLGVLSFLNDPEITFEEHHIAINEGPTSVKFRYGAPSLVVAPPSKSIMCDKDVQFKLPSLTFQNVMRAQGAMQLKHIGIKGNSQGIFLSALDFKNVSGDSFDVQVANSNGHDFLMLFEPTNLKIINDDYDVSLSAKLLMHLKGSKVEYWIPAEKDSFYK